MTGFAEIPEDQVIPMLKRLLSDRQSHFLRQLKFKLEERINTNGIDTMSRTLNVSKELLHLIACDARTDKAWKNCIDRYKECEAQYESDRFAASPQASISPEMVRNMVSLVQSGTLPLQEVLESLNITEEQYYQWVGLMTGVMQEARDSEVYTREFREKLCQDYLAGEVTEREMFRLFCVSKMMLKRWFNQARMSGEQRKRPGF